MSSVRGRRKVAARVAGLMASEKSRVGRDKPADARDLFRGWSRFLESVHVIVVVKLKMKVVVSETFHPSLA